MRESARTLRRTGFKDGNDHASLARRREGGRKVLCHVEMRPRVETSRARAGPRRGFVSIRRGRRAACLKTNPGRGGGRDLCRAGSQEPKKRGRANRAGSRALVSQAAQRVLKA